MKDVDKDYVSYGQRENLMYEYGIRIKRVIDGDTIVVDIDLGFGTWLMDKHVRLWGIDAPEKSTVEGKLATQCAIEFLLKHDPKTYILDVIEHKSDKYGRILGKIVHICPTTKFVTEMHLSMIAAGHAKAYFGGKKNVR